MSKCIKKNISVQIFINNDLFIGNMRNLKRWKAFFDC